jgi:UDP-2-acetamido-3-amino-2,3-dideoxy-glucuronate N-acetyltransferase
MTEGVFVHEQGLCESDDVGSGTRIWAFAHVLPGARVGRDCNICDGAYVENGAVLGDRVTVKNQALVFDRVEVGDDCFLGPGVVFTNDLNPRSKLREGDAHLLETKVGAGVTLGANSTVICGIEIGAHAFVGAGSVVSGDLLAHALAVGSPARQVGWACLCGKRLDEDLSCADCGRRFRLEAGERLVAAGAAVRDR